MTIKLTQEQADALERLKSAIVPDELFGMPTVSILEAMKKGYEIKLEFKKGDWVYIDDWRLVGNIVQTKNELATVEFLQKNFIVAQRTIDFSAMRPATPEEIAEEQERRKWAAIGREIGTLKKGDIVYTHDKELYVVHDPDYEPGGRISILSADRMQQAVVFEHDVKLVCPVENQFEHGLKL